MAVTGQFDGLMGLNEHGPTEPSTADCREDLFYNIVSEQVTNAKDFSSVAFYP